MQFLDNCLCLRGKYRRKGRLGGGLVVTGVFTFRAGAGYKIGHLTIKLEVFVVIKSNKII